MLRVQNFFTSCFFFLGTHLLLLATLSRLVFGCDFLPNSGNITPFVRWNKQKELVVKWIFMLLNQVKYYERFHHKKKLCQPAHLCIVQYLAL